MIVDDSDRVMIIPLFLLGGREGFNSPFSGTKASTLHITHKHTQEKEKGGDFFEVANKEALARAQGHEERGKERGLPLHFAHN